MPRQLKFGALPPRIDKRNLQFSNYITPLLAPPPVTIDNLARAYKVICILSRGSMFPMDGNDQYGDCTIAGAAHAITVYRAMIGQKYIPGSSDVVNLYFKLSGGKDTGLVELDVLNYWRKYGMFGDKILAYVSVNPKNHIHVEQAIWMFGGVYIAFMVPDNCMNQFYLHQTWTPGNLTDSAHAVFVANYDLQKLTTLTWGRTQCGSWEWWDQCVIEAYAILPPEAVSALFQPGFNLGQLQADLLEVTGSR